MSKLEVASRQLVTAIDLYFQGRDAVAIWTLACAAYNVLRDLTRHSGTPPMLLKDQLPSLIPEENRSNLWNYIQAPEIFFKHADRDPEGGLADDFADLGRLELLLFDACVAHHHLSGDSTSETALMRMWFLANATFAVEPHEEFEQWLRQISKKPGETARDYRDRLFHVACQESEAGQHRGEVPAPNTGPEADV